MRKIVLLCLVVMLIGNIGIVSAESNVLNFKYKFSNIAVTETWTISDYDYQPDNLEFSNIANYPAVTKIVVSDVNSNRVYKSGVGVGPFPEITELETSFILRTTNGVQVGKGTYATTRYISNGVSTGSTEILRFDEWNIGSLSGSCKLFFSYDDRDQIVYHATKRDKNGISSSPIEGSVRFTAGTYSSYGFGQTVRVWNDYKFDQDLYYNYDEGLGEIEISLERKNVWSNLTLLYDITNEVICISRSSEDFYRLQYLDGQAIKVILIDSMGREWSNVIPSYIGYKPIPPSVIGSTIGNIGAIDLNLTGYRYQIEKLPLLGNLSIPYLNFVDGVSSDINEHIYGVISVLMAPLYILNEKVVIISNMLADQIEGLISGLDIITGPMQSVVNAIPGKVMGFFVFFLLLDIIRVIIGWGM